MLKKPIFTSLAIICVVMAFMVIYATMFANVNGIETFLNRKDENTVPVSSTGTVKPVQTPETTQDGFTAIPVETAEPTLDTKPEITYTDIKISSVGDFLIHENVLKAQYNEESKVYDFGSIFSQVAPILSAADYAVGSLEVPTAGEAEKYSGFPQFNSPDTLIDGLKNTGLKLLVAAGTHAFDKSESGLKRTISTVSSKGMQITGTKANANDKSYIIADVKGVKIGIINYTAASRRDNDKISLNSNTLTAEQEKLINIFEYSKLDVFYNGLKDQIGKMKSDGAEVFVCYLRWGTDYTIKENENQRKIAKELCNLGIDIIFGNGPHMIQPFETFKSDSGVHTMLCMYSLGNFISNQRREEISHKSGHTEDGIIYTVNIRKYSDGTVKVGKIEYVATWVSLEKNSQNGKQSYTILPFNEANNAIEAAKESFKRTDNIVSENINKYNSALTIDDSVV